MARRIVAARRAAGRTEVQVEDTELETMTTLVVEHGNGLSDDELAELVEGQARDRIAELEGNVGGGAPPMPGRAGGRPLPGEGMEL